MEAPKERQDILKHITTENVLSTFKQFDHDQMAAMLKILGSLTPREKLDLESSGVFYFDDLLDGITHFDDHYVAKDTLAKILDVFPGWQTDYFFETKHPLHETLRLAHFDLFDILLEKGADPAACTYNKDGAHEKNLLDASVECNLNHRIQEAVVTAALDAHPFDQASMDFALVTAVRNNNLGGVRALIKRGAALGAKSGHKALSIACFMDDDQKADETVEWLLKAKNIKKFLNKGWDAENFSPMHSAAYKGRTKTMDMLFAKGAFVEHPKKKEEPTPLMLAASNSEPEAIEWLLAHGANPKAHDKNGENALHWLASASAEIYNAAYEKEHSVPSALLLIKAGVSLLTKNKDGKTPQDLAHENGFLFLKTLFSEHGLRETLKDGIEKRRKASQKFDEKKVPKM